MRTNKILTLLLLAGSVLLASPSCTREEVNIPAAEESERVPVSFAFSVAGMEAGTPETKAVIEPETMDHDATTAEQINNFVVLQFDGTTDNAKLVGVKNSFPYSAEDEQSDGAVGKLIPSENPATIVVVANMKADDIYAPTEITLGKFKEGYSTLTQYAGVLYSEGGNDYLRMCGMTEVASVYFGMKVEVSLIRNVSKITINVRNNTTGDDQVTLQKVQLRDINAKFYYLTPLDASKEAAYTDIYSAKDRCRIDKEQESFTDNASLQTFTYYIPANLRGTTDNEKQYSKGLGAPDGATRFCLYGTYGPDNTPINYTYYLGGNLVNDFNLKPNHAYTYNITLNAKGDSRYDYRVEDLAEEKFHVDANSYMLHPPKAEGQSRIYAIPIRRAATFWNKEGENGGVYGANQWDKMDYSAWNITPETTWTAEVLWNDFGLSDYSDFLIKNSGTGYDPTKPTQDPYFKIKVKAGMKGNALVAVKVGANIVWSWHLWITDYNPDQEGLSPVAGTYFYDVEGGQVLRFRDKDGYAHPVWNKEPTENEVGYRNGFIMDRNLGALGVLSFDDQKYSLFYEFGRKDPFGSPNGKKLTTKDQGATGQPFVYIINDDLSKRTAANNLRYAVCNPDVYITFERNMSSLGWTYTEEEDLFLIGEGWYDPKYFDHTGNQEVLEIKKSIYDPCPPGWKVPSKYFLQDLVTPYENSSHSIAVPGDRMELAGDGAYYYPGGKKEGKNMFPFLGMVSGYGTINVTEKVRSRVWTDLSFSYIQGHAYNIMSTEVNSYKVYQAQGYNIRCVREYGVVNNER